MLNRSLATLALSCLWITARAQTPTPFDPAAAFGARPSTDGVFLAPDGRSVAYLVPTKGQGSAIYTLSLSKGATPQLALNVDGNPFRIGPCRWLAKDRLACSVYAVKQAVPRSLVISRLIAFDADGKNFQILSTIQNQYSHGYQLAGGSVIDWLPDENGAVLMTRNYLPDTRSGTRLGSIAQGSGVDWLDTRTLEVKHVEAPRTDVLRYLTDGRGAVRIVAVREMHNGGEAQTGVIKYYYRLVGSKEWLKLSDYNFADHTGFDPVAINHDLNAAYGFKKKNGRMALYAVKLDESLSEEVIHEDTEADVLGIEKLGRLNRVVGALYSTSATRVDYFEPQAKSVAEAVRKALPERTVSLIDCSDDGTKVLIFAGSDVDPGAFYIFDRNTLQLQTFYVSRGGLENIKLAHAKPVTYSAADGTQIPAYLTLPPGREEAKGLPAIVLPHDGLAQVEEGGFDWMAQFFAARGYAVLQPNFRGSRGLGDNWFQKNGFRSWHIAIGDISDGGRWLVREGIADPAKLGIVGWSYGGYAALQSAVVDPTLFKAVIAIAPLTDLTAYKEARRRWSDFEVISKYIGDGPHMHEGSPIEHAKEIKAPVLLFHGGHDADIEIQQSKSMAARLKSAGARYELVTWDELDNQLEDSEARTQMLRKSDEFLRKAFGM